GLTLKRPRVSDDAGPAPKKVLPPKTLAAAAKASKTASKTSKPTTKNSTTAVSNEKSKAAITPEKKGEQPTQLQLPVVEALFATPSSSAASANSSDEDLPPSTSHSLQAAGDDVDTELSERNDDAGNGDLVEDEEQDDESFDAAVRAAEEIPELDLPDREVTEDDLAEFYADLSDRGLHVPEGVKDGFDKLGWILISLCISFVRIMQLFHVYHE
ncbi:hypothetical protein HDU79_002310, partial [Rhizoclosmatium sp. JEL0117]